MILLGHKGISDVKVWYALFFTIFVRMWKLDYRCGMIYHIFEICKALPSDEDEIKSCAHNIRPLVDMLLPYMSECSDPVFSKRLEKQVYL